MKLRVTLEGNLYDVDVEMLPQRPGLNGAVALAAPPAAPGMVSKPVAVTPVEAKPAAKAPAARTPLRERPIDVTAYFAGTVTDLSVKLGDGLRAGDPLLRLEAGAMMTSGGPPFSGFVRAAEAGVVHELLVKKGDAVRAGQVLLRIK